MTIEKLPSGSYRITKMYKGKRYRVTVNHKPKKSEADMLISEKITGNNVRIPQKGTLESYADKYIEKCKKAKESPATVRGYEIMKRTTGEQFLKMNFCDFTPDDYKQMVEYYRDNPSAKNIEKRSTKTVKNYNGFYKLVFAEYGLNYNYTVEEPKKVKKKPYRPTTKDVMAILDYAKGTEYYVALRLAAIGLRRGEICALTINDLSDTNVLTINKDIIKDENGKLVVKETPKTNASNREILIPADIADAIRTQGYVYKYCIDQIRTTLLKYEKRLGIPEFTLHTLRKFAAAYMHKKGMTMEEIKDYCGWERTSQVAEIVYLYNLDPDESQKHIADIFTELV